MYVGFVLPLFSTNVLLSQPNILIDKEGSPRLSDFGLCSITKNINSVNASTPNHGCTVRYRAPELLDIGGVVKVGKKKSTNESDVYSLSMVIVEVRLLPENMMRSDSDCFRFQLATGKIPFHGFGDHEVITKVSKGRRPSKPHRFDAKGITPAVWKIAEKCWHQKVRERPEVKAILQRLEDLQVADAGMYIPEACSYLKWEIIDL